MTKKEFALREIAPYAKDYTKCGYDNITENCTYYSPEGKKCVFGANLINPEMFKDDRMDADDLILSYGEEILIPSSRGILTPKEWKKLQELHDFIAIFEGGIVRFDFNNFPLFTEQELKDYCNEK